MSSDPSAASTFDRDGYLVLKGVLPEAVCNFGVNYFWLLKNAGMLSKGDNLVPDACWCGYGIPYAETILALLVDRVSSLVGDKLLPTYSYSRIYLPGAQMRKHKDRPSCEVSATLTLGYKASEPWSLFMENKEQKSLDIKLQAGDMLLYKGVERPHWREKWEVDSQCWQIQIFLHFVRADGQFKDHVFDDRPGLGMTKKTPKRL